MQDISASSAKKIHVKNEKEVNNFNWKDYEIFCNPKIKAVTSVYYHK